MTIANPQIKKAAIQLPKISFLPASRVEVVFCNKGHKYGSAFHGLAETVLWRSKKNVFIASKFLHP